VGRDKCYDQLENQDKIYLAYCRAGTSIETCLIAGYDWRIVSAKKPKKSRQARRTVTDQERIEITLRRYQDRASLTELSRIYRRSPSLISRFTSEAFRRNLVEVRAVTHVEIEPDPRLEARLRNEYPSLHGVIVVQTPKDASSDQVHELLGRAMAQHIARGAVIRNSDTVALSGGRAVYHMVEALRGMPKLRAADVLVVSLCGDVYPHHDSRDKNLRLDSDTNVNLLGPVFETLVKQRMISRPIGRLGSESAKSDFYNAKDWPGRFPTHAFTGLGVIAQQHRMVALAEKPEDHLLVSKDVRELLFKLIELSKRYQHVGGSREPYYPVAEIAHHILFVPPPTDISIPPKDRMGFESTIEALNAKLFVPRKDDFDRMGSMYLLAGTRLKAGAIRHLLKPQPDSPAFGLPIRFLCIDQAAATALLG
jgi:hypothetical protein